MKPIAMLFKIFKILHYSYSKFVSLELNKINSLICDLGLWSVQITENKHYIYPYKSKVDVVRMDSSIYR